MRESMQCFPTRRNGQQLSLDSVDEIFNLLRRPAPEDETMPWIYVARFDSRIIQPQQDGVNADPGKSLSSIFAFC